MNAVVLYRRGCAGSRADDDRELAAIVDAGLDVVALRTKLAGAPRGMTVVPRYAMWPWHRELIDDIAEMGHRAINDHAATGFLRDTLAWSHALDEMTPWSTTWSRYVDAVAAGAASPRDPVVLKVGDRSHKERWRTHMFAADHAEAIEVMRRLLDMGTDADELVVRNYVRFDRLKDKDHRDVRTAGGCPVVVEHRIFVLDGKELCRGFYWDTYAGEIHVAPDPAHVPAWFVESAHAQLIEACPSLRFYALDVARTVTGWWVVEVNDGCQSGLQGCDPVMLYSGLAKHIG